MSRKPCIVAVLGYGCHISPEIAQYLEKVAAFTEKNPVHRIITSGGFTNPTTKPGVSEAHMLAYELELLLRDREIRCRIVEDEEPIDTRGNLRGIERIRNGEQLEHLPLVIFCDGVHAPKIRLFSLFLHRSWPRIKTHSLTRGLVPKLKHLFLVTALEMGALAIPYMERRRIERRQRIIANS